MSDDLLNILSNSNKDIDNQKLMDYLSDKLSAEEKHEVEKTLVDSELMNDAVEGLEKFKDKIENKKTKKQKRQLKEMPWLYFSVILITLIILIGFFVIWKHLNP